MLVRKAEGFVIHLDEVIMLAFCLGGIGAAVVHHGGRRGWRR
jgi:hypothetical protein